MTGCKLRAAAPGYRSEVIPLNTNRTFFDNYDVGKILLHRIEDVEAPSVSATSLKAPSDARRAFEKGLEALGKGKTPEMSWHQMAAEAPSGPSVRLAMGGYPLINMNNTADGSGAAGR